MARGGAIPPLWSVLLVAVAFSLSSSPRRLFFLSRFCSDLLLLCLCFRFLLSLDLLRCFFLDFLPLLLEYESLVYDE